MLNIMKKKSDITTLITVVVIMCGALILQSFAKFDSSSPTSTEDRYRTFVKTSYKCQKSNCSCSGYWGYKHQNGTFEGSCSNSDGHGHTCGHGPESHGLRKW